MDNKKRNRLVIVKTERQWEIINKRIKELGYSDFSRFLNSRLSALHQDYIQHKTQVEKASAPNKKIKEFRISKYTPFDYLKEISDKTGVPIPKIVDRIILTPILQEH